MRPTLKNIVSRNPDIVGNKIDGELVLMNIDDGSFFGLNAVGTAIWHRLEEPASVEDIVVHIVETFAVSQEQCQTDTLSFIENMVDGKALLIDQ